MTNKAYHLLFLLSPVLVLLTLVSSVQGQGACYPASLDVTFSGSGSEVYDVNNGFQIEHLSHTFSLTATMHGDFPIVNGDLVHYIVSSCQGTFIYFAQGQRQLIPGLTETKTVNLSINFTFSGAVVDILTYSISQGKVIAAECIRWQDSPSSNNGAYEGFSFDGTDADMWVYIDTPQGWSFEDILETTGTMSIEAFPDTQPPLALCKDVAIQLDENCEASLSPEDVNDGSYDLCGLPVQLYSLSQSSFGIDDLGEKQVALTVHDDAGNSSSCNATVTVEKASLEFWTENKFNPKKLRSKTEDDDCAAPFVKVCADGSEEVSKLILTGCENPGNYQLRIEQDQALFGSFTLIEADEEEASWWYKHPNVIYEQAGVLSFTTFKEVTLQVVKMGPEEKVVASMPIRLYRAPVAMIHGVWSNRDETFGSLKATMTQTSNAVQVRWTPSLVAAINYKTTNSNHFYQNSQVGISAVRTAITNAWADEFSVGRANVVAHSMGGLLARMYAQSGDYQSEICRLITVNTPHSGTQTANYLLNGSEYLRHQFNSNGRPVGNGAVEDLQVGSLALEGLNSPFNGSANAPPCHAIATYEPGPVSLLDGIAPWAIILWIKMDRNNADPYVFLAQDIFGNQQNDLIVPLNSQTGGLSGSQITVVADQWHSSISNIEVYYAIASLLNAEPSSTSFSQDGFHPVPLEYIAPSPSSALVNTGDGALTITNPPEFSVFQPGTDLQIQTEGSENVQAAMFSTTGTSIDNFWDFKDEQSPTFNYFIPQQAIGSLKVSVTGYDDDGQSSGSGNAGNQVAEDHIWINVVPDEEVVNIAIQGEAIYVSVGGLTPIPVTALFSDGVERYISELPATSILVEDSTAAKIVAPGIATGLAPDTTRLFITYEGKSDTVNLIVLPPATPLSLEISQDTLWFADIADTQHVSVFSAGAPWWLEETPDWISVSIESGIGNANISIQCEPNESDIPRQGLIQVAAPTLIRQITLIQAGQAAFLSTDPDTLRFPASLDTQAIVVFSNVDWSVTDKPAWVTLSPASGFGFDSLAVICQPNPYTSPRSGTIKIVAGGLQQNVFVYQKRKVILPNPPVPTPVPGNPVMLDTPPGEGTEAPAEWSGQGHFNSFQELAMSVEISLSVFPNPVKNAATIAFTLPDAQAVRLEVSDFSGRQVAVLAEGEFSEGRHEIEWTPEGLPPGVYCCRLLAGGSAVVRIVLY